MPVVLQRQDGPLRLVGALEGGILVDGDRSRTRLGQDGAERIGGGLKDSDGVQLRLVLRVVDGVQPGLLGSLLRLDGGLLLVLLRLPEGEAEEQQADQDESDNRVFIHCSLRFLPAGSSPQAP